MKFQKQRRGDIVHMYANPEWRLEPSFAGLINRFRGHQTQHERTHEQPGEGVDDFITPEKLIPERQLVNVLKKGLRNGIARFYYAMDVLTVDELWEECVEVEKTLRVSEALIPDEVDEQQILEVNELRGRTRNPFRPGCWNCGAEWL